jgi:hypothetical protein
VDKPNKKHGADSAIAEVVQHIIPILQTSGLWMKKVATGSANFGIIGG